MGKHNYRVSLESPADPADIVECLEGAGFGVLEVAVSGWNEKRQARAESALAIVRREAHKPAHEAVMTREEIAKAAGVSVMLTSGAIKENANDPDVGAYILRGKADRAVEKARASAAAAVAHAEALAAARVPAGSGNGGTRQGAPGGPVFAS